MVKVADLGPGPFGVKATPTWQDPPGATGATHVEEVVKKSGPWGPPKLVPEMVSGAVPLLRPDRWPEVNRLTGPTLPGGALHREDQHGRDLRL